MNQLEYYSFMGYPAQSVARALHTIRGSLCARKPGTRCGLRPRGVPGAAEGAGFTRDWIDADANKVELVQPKGLEAIQADRLGCLREHPREFDGGFAAHLIEHMAPDPLLELARRPAQRSEMEVA